MKITRRNGLFGLATGAIAAAGSGAVARSAQARTPSRITPAHRTLIRNADVITLDPALGELIQTDVLLDGGKIAGIGKNLRVDGAEVIDATGMILMPGMIDGHRHVWGGIDIGRVPKISPRINTYQDWKMRTMVAYRPEDAYLYQYAGGIMAIESGVTSVLDYCHIFHTQDLAEQAARGLKDSGIAGTWCYQVSHTPSYGPGDTVSYAQAEAERSAPADENHWRIVEHVRRTVFTGDSDLLRFGLAGSARGGGVPISELSEEFAKIRSYAPHMLAIHYQHRERSGAPDGTFRDLWDLQRAGLLGPDFHIAHGNAIPDDQLALLKDTGGMICATTMGEHSYPSPSVHGRARRAGVHVGIGLDAALAFTHDYFQHLRGGFYNLFRTDEGKQIALGFEASDMLDFVAGKAALAIREDNVGTISVGKRADLLLLKTDRLSFPIYGLLAERVANYSNGQDLDSVWIAGVARKRNGQMVGVDVANLKERVNAASRRIIEAGDTITFTT
nr:amidohydrolase family protein [uncultured Brevundimonas sp.]